MSVWAAKSRSLKCVHAFQTMAARPDEDLLRLIDIYIGHILFYTNWAVWARDPCWLSTCPWEARTLIFSMSGS